MENNHRAGFVNIIGNPNVGKSTLMNALVGERVSIITSKAQTTRHRIMGIVNGDDFQIVYSDTPGLLKPNYKLQETMLKFATGAMSDADILIYVTDVEERITAENEFIAKISRMDTPVIVVVNKIDLLKTQEQLEVITEHWHEMLPKANIIPVSALNKFNLGMLFDRIVELLPVSPPYYPKDALTDKSLRFFASEIIREKILLNYKEEVPYSVEVAIEEYVEGEDLDRIGAVIYVARESQKGIIIGHKGERLKRVGTAARKDMEAFLDKKVFLQMFVKVNADWRNNERQLKTFGYME